MKPTEITVFPTYITVPSDEYGYLSDYRTNIKTISGKFVEFEFRPGQRPIPKQRFTLFDKQNNCRIMPRHALRLLTTYLDSCSVEYNITYGEYTPPRKVDIPINPKWKVRDHQIPAIQFLVNKTHSMRLLSLQTGEGKSFSAAKAASELGVCTIVIVSGLVDQWESNFREQTLLNSEDIYVIKGSGSLINLFTDPEYKPKIFIASAETIKPYIVGAHDSNWPNWKSFCYHYGIGTKIIDEMHVRFMSNTEIDLNTEIENNIYLSATPSRSGNRERQIFDLIFPSEIHYGGNEYKKYVDTFFYHFYLDLGIKERKVTTRNGYSHAKYEGYLHNNAAKYAEWIQDVIYPLVNSHYINHRSEGQKCLLFVNTIAFAEKMVSSLQKLYPNLNISTFLGRDSDSVLEEADIIVSTHKSAGTGNDIKNLITCGNTCSFQTDIQTRQMIGRLRQISDTKLIMFDISNMFFNAHGRHAGERIRTYKNISKTFHESELK